MVDVSMPVVCGLLSLVLAYVGVAEAADMQALDYRPERERPQPRKPTRDGSGGQSRAPAKIRGKPVLCVSKFLKR